MFNPALMGNSCCLTNVNNSATYINYFLETDKIKEIYTKIGYVFSNETMLKNQNSVFKTYLNEVYTLPTFRNNIFPQKILLKKRRKDYLRLMYQVGNILVKNVFYNDICIYTNNTYESQITSKEYTYEEYISLLKTIQELNLKNLNNYRIENKLQKEDDSNNADNEPAFEVGN